jgi:hypothetical protein
MVFCVGQVVATRGVAYEMEKDKEFERFVRKSFSRHATGDWGDMCEEDKAYNDEALANGGRLFSAYKNGDTKIWIITEYDRSATTILFPEEY